MPSSRRITSKDATIPFGNKSSGESKRVRFGIRKPDNEELLIQSLREAHRLGNDLVEAELKRRNIFREAREEIEPQLKIIRKESEKATQKLDEIYKGIREQNSKERKRQELSDDLKKEIKLLKAQRNVYDMQYKKLAKSIDKKEGMKTVKEDLNEISKSDRKTLYDKYKGSLYWPTINTVIQDRIKGNRDPRFRPFKGTGQLSLQIQKPAELCYDQILSCADNRVRIEIIEHDGKKKYGILWFRIGSEDNKPVWAKFEIFLHRDIPADGSIKWVHIIRNKVGRKYKWEAQFVVSRDRWEKHESGDKSIVLDVGYRMIESGLRVACYKGSDGKEGELVIPSKQLDRFSKVEDLQSIRSKKYETVLAEFRAWMKGNFLPDGIKERVETISQWKSSSQTRFHSVIEYWRNNRFDGDKAMFEHLESWRKKDVHLMDWQESQRRSNLNWRKNFYHNWVVETMEEYGKWGIEKVNWAVLQKTPDPENYVGVNTKTRGIAAIGLLHQIISEKCDTTLLNARNTSRRCNSCKKLCKPDGKNQFHTYSSNAIAKASYLQ